MQFLAWVRFLGQLSRGGHDLSLPALILSFPVIGLSSRAARGRRGGAGTALAPGSGVRAGRGRDQRQQADTYRRYRK
jgi:hypothetical protein